MAEVLSQSQIDALLGSLNNPSSNAVEEKKEEKSYRKYDFASPKKFTKEKLKILKGIYDNYCRIASSQINSLFRVNSELSVIAVEEQRYYEFSNALSDDDIFTLVKCSVPNTTKNPPIMMHISQVLVVNLIDRMLGGTDNDTSIDSSYQYTDIEKALYQRIMEYLITPIQDVWSGYVKLETKLDKIEENLGMFQDIAVDDIVMIIAISVDIQSIAGTISICIPGDLLANIFHVIDQMHMVDRTYDEVDNESKDDIMDNIEQSMLEVKAQIDSVQLTLNDVYNLRVGDVIDLNCSKNSDVSVLIGSTKWFTAQVGMFNKNVAIKIKDKIQALEDGIELKLVQEELLENQEDVFLDMDNHQIE